MNFYPVGLAEILDGSVSWDSSDVRAAFLADSYQFMASHTMLDDILASRVIATSDVLEGPSEEDGVFGGLPFRFAPFLDERNVSHVVVYIDSGDPAYSVLVAHWGPSDVIGLPFVPAGLEYFVHSDAELGGFFRAEESGLIGPINTYGLGAPYAIGDFDGGLDIDTPTLFTSGRLSVSAQVCLPADEPDSCCRPTFRGTRCE